MLYKKSNKKIKTVYSLEIAHLKMFIIKLVLPVLYYTIQICNNNNIKLSQAFKKRLKVIGTYFVVVVVPYTPYMSFHIKNWF